MRLITKSWRLAWYRTITDVIHVFTCSIIYVVWNNYDDDVLPRDKFILRFIYKIDFRYSTKCYSIIIYFQTPDVVSSVYLQHKRQQKNQKKSLTWNWAEDTRNLRRAHINFLAINTRINLKLRNLIWETGWVLRL